MPAAALLLTAIVPALQERFKIREQFHKTAAVIFCSTGLSGVGADTSKASQFVAHTLNGTIYPNTLYQAFLAVHYDEMDTVLTFHSAAGRTYSGHFPGDTNTFIQLARGPLEQNSKVDSHTAFFTFRGGSSRMKIQQNLYARKDTSYRVHMDYVFTFYPATSPDTVRFTNIRIMFGYDGDIGTSLGGYSNDSCGYYRDDSTKLIYIYDWHDSTKSVFAGLSLLSGGAEDSAGNRALFHQTVNDYGSSMASLDTVLYGMMANPSMDPALQNTDLTVYWTVRLGDKFTDNPRDTLTDTVRFVWVNGFSRDGLIRSAKGLKVSPPVINPPVAIPDKTRLLNNYPNPFNAGTKIRYELSYSGEVSLIVYNALGQKVRTLVKQYQYAGAHSVYWDGRDESGKTVAGGLYIYRLKSGDLSMTQKCLMVK